MSYSEHKQDEREKKTQTSLFQILNECNNVLSMAVTQATLSGKSFKEAHE